MKELTFANVYIKAIFVASRLCYVIAPKQGLHNAKVLEDPTFTQEGDWAKAEVVYNTETLEYRLEALENCSEPTREQLVEVMSHISILLRKANLYQADKIGPAKNKHTFTKLTN